MVVDRSAKPSGVLPNDVGGELNGDDPRGEVAYMYLDSGEPGRAALPIGFEKFEAFVRRLAGEGVLGGGVFLCSGVTARKDVSGAGAGSEENSFVTLADEDFSLLLVDACDDARLVRRRVFM